MKRRLIVTVVVAALVLALGILGEIQSRRIARDYSNRLLAARSSLSARDWPRLLEALDDIEQKWDQQNGVVQLWVNHGDTDHITLGLKALRAALETQSETEALTHYYELLENFGHLYHRDAFTLKNIL